MLENERAQIDQIDRQLVKLFEERMKVSQSIAQIKKAHQMEVLDEEREAKVLDKVTEYLEDESLAPHLQDFYKELMRISRQRQLLIIDEIIE